jgi:hypothetical protein
MHTTFETELELPVSAAEAWDTLSDMSRWRRWTRVFDVGPETPRPTWRPGVRFRVGPELLGLRLWADVTIVEARAPEVLTWEGSLFGIPGRHGFRFEPVGERRCRMTHWEQCGGLGGYLAVGSGAWCLLQRRFRRFNRDLRIHLERT